MTSITAPIPTRFAALLACAALLPPIWGCTSWHLAEPGRQALEPVGPVAPNVARVCVVRTAVLALAVPFPTHDDGVLVGTTRGPTFFCYLAEPGEHAIDIEADEMEHARLTAEGGRTYFLKEEVDNIFGYVKCRAVWVTEEVGQELVKGADYRVLVGVPGTERLPPEVPYAPALRGRAG
jgi:hypothetical protein